MKFPLRKSRLRLALLGLMIVVLIILLRHTGLVFENMALTTDVGGRKVSNLGGVTGSLSMSLFLILLVLAQLVHLRRDETAASAETKKVTNRAWIVGFVGTFMVIISLIIYVDPRELYGTNIYESRLVLVRDDKIDAYTRLAETPDVVVLGSSRAFTVLPEFFQQDFGYSAFNMSVEAGRPEDYVIQTRFILDRDPENPPKVLMIEVMPPLIEGSGTVAQRSPLSLLPYMERATAKLAVQARAEGLFDLHQLDETINILRYYALNGSPPLSWKFGPDGGGNYETNVNMQAALHTDISKRNLPRCAGAKLDREGTRRLERIVEMAGDHQLAVIFYTTPRHPVYYDRLMAGTKRYLNCEMAIQTYMDDLTSRYPFVFFLNYTRLEDIRGVADETGYYDSQHMTALNNHYLLQAAADTIRQAYTLAKQQRANR